jgi:hypothetical protein
MIGLQLWLPLFFVVVFVTCYINALHSPAHRPGRRTCRKNKQRTPPWCRAGRTTTPMIAAADATAKISHGFR